MSEIDDVKRIGGQPAYPTMAAIGRFAEPVGINFGLTKREYAAIAAMQGLLPFPGEIRGDDITATIARMSVQYADALLAELVKEPTR